MLKGFAPDSCERKGKCRKQICPRLVARNMGVSQLHCPVSRYLETAQVRARKKKKNNKQESGVNKSARERIGRQNLSQKVPSKKGSLGVIFSPRNYREKAHSKSTTFEGRHSGGHLLGRPLLFTSERKCIDKHFTGLSRIIPGLSRDCPGIFRRFYGNFVDVFPFSPKRRAHKLSGMFRRSASLAIPHLKSFAAIPSVSLALLGHTNRNVFLSHESQHEIALVKTLSRPIPYYQQGEVGEEKRACVSQGMCF